ncbi:MAG: HAMP domain-containing histidine kinase [Lachnospiraceae bacterium]|nr:HAMP domain-containing histidine kinase [Lachnospiraceae bacterium]
MRKGERKKVVRLCVAIEVFAIAVVAVLLFVMHRYTRESVEANTEAKGTEFMRRADHPAYYSCFSKIRQGDPEFWLEAIELVVFSLQQEEAYDEGYAAVAYYMDTASGVGMVMEGDIAVVAVDSGTERRTWNLREYFPGEELERLIKTVFESRNRKKVWTHPRILQLWGRDAADGTVALTKMTLQDPSLGDDYTIASADCSGTDRPIWDWSEAMKKQPSETAESNAQAEARLYLLAQDKALAGLLAETDDDVLGASGRYAIFTQEYTFQSTGGDAAENPEDFDAGEIGEDATVNFSAEVRRAAGGEIVAPRDGEISSEYTVRLVFDNRKIAWNRLRKPVILVIAFGQTFAFLAMILTVSARRRREELRRLRDMFINAMAHELKTPAAVIKNTSEYLSLEPKPEKTAHYLEVLSRESDSLNGKINRMLTYTRIVDGNTNLNRTETDLNRLTDAVIASYADLAAAKGMTIDFSKRSDEKISCDPALMSMVIDNLVGNAVRYGEPDSAVVVETRGKGFRVRNRTAALSEEELREIWTPMYQTRRKQEDSKTGGMGLAISAGILERHGASYGVCNRDGGLLFWFEFAKAREVERSIKYAWINLLTVSIAMISAFLWAMNYMRRGSRFDLVLTIFWLIYAVCFARAYESMRSGKWVRAWCDRLAKKNL